MVASCTDEQRELLKQFKTLHFQPFDPVGKKTVAKIQSPEGEVFHTTKGAPQVILGLAENGPKIRKSVLAVSTLSLSLSFPLRSLTTHTHTHTPPHNNTHKLAHALHLSALDSLLLVRWAWVPVRAAGP
jgi:magnesium-transporting ATPase (P-type)